MSRLAVIVLVAVLAGPAAAAAPGPARPLDPQELTKAFFRTVFGLEYGAGQPDAYRVKRYSGWVRFHVSDLSGQRRGPAARAFLRRLPREIANLRAQVVPREEDANFRVFLVREADFEAVVSRELSADARAMNARCLVGVSTQEGRITRSTAVIVADDDYLFRRCLVEEVLQGLGPMNDDDRLTESVFNDTSVHARFTAFDRALLNILYHPAVRPGMTGTQVHRVLPGALYDLGLSQ